MKVEILIDRTKTLPTGAITALEAEFGRRLENAYPGCSLTIKKAGSDGLSIFGCEKSDKERIAEILEDTWHSADDWFYIQ